MSEHKEVTINHNMLLSLSCFLCGNYLHQGKTREEMSEEITTELRFLLLEPEGITNGSKHNQTLY